MWHSCSLSFSHISLFSIINKIVILYSTLLSSKICMYKSEMLQAIAYLYLSDNNKEHLRKEYFWILPI